MVDIVVSYYNDLQKLNDWPLELIKNKGMNFVFYKKEDNLNVGNEYVTNNNHIAIPNIGRCDYAFFYHIVKNYHNLPDYTVFTKINWKYENLNFEKFIDNCVGYDYCGCGSQDKIESIVWCDNSCVEKARSLNTNYRKDITNLDAPKNLHIRHIKYAETLEDWYSYIFGKQNLPKVVDTHVKGPCFSVSKRAILSNKLSDYEYLLNRFYKSSNSWNYEKCRFCEEDGRMVLADSNGMEGHPYFHGKKLDEQTDISFHFHDNFLRFYKTLFVKDGFLVGNIN